MKTEHPTVSPRYPPQNHRKKSVMDASDNHAPFAPTPPKPREHPAQLCVASQDAL